MNPWIKEDAMSVRRSARLLPCAALAVAGLLWLPAAVSAAFEKSLTLTADALELLDPIGEVRLEPAAGEAYEIVVRVDGRDATEERVRVEQAPGDPARVLVRFPTDRERDYVYPRLGRGSSSSFTLPERMGGNAGWLELLRGAGGKPFRVRGGGKGLEIWADVTIRVPAGKKTDVRLGVGAMTATGLVGDVRLDTGSGPVTATDIRGDLVVDTGSGRVEASGIRGSARIDTGSGAVALADCAGPETVVDTGSGGVELTRVEGRSLRVDTGSGSVRATALAVEEVAVDTGSGAVRLDIARLGPGGCRVDTGSGAIDLALPQDASAVVHAETGTGAIRYTSAEDNLSADDEVSFRIGDGGPELRLETGSGEIRIRQ
jgi:hypothetical protein